MLLLENTAKSASPLFHPQHPEGQKCRICGCALVFWKNHEQSGLGGSLGPEALARAWGLAATSVGGETHNNELHDGMMWSVHYKTIQIVYDSRNLLLLASSFNLPLYAIFHMATMFPSFDSQLWEYICCLSHPVTTPGMCTKPSPTRLSLMDSECDDSRAHRERNFA